MPESAAARLGYPRVHLRSTDSTNDRARELALAGAPHGTLVTASEQSAGRGRQGRRWSAPAGSALLMSLLLRPPPRLLPLMAAIAVAEVAGGNALIKWPNDVVVPLERGGGAGLAKLAGILMEGRPQEGWAVLGIGINVAVRLQELPPELRPDAEGSTPTGLPAATLGGEPGDVEPTLMRLLDALQRSLELSPEETLESWRRRDALRGRQVSWSSGSGRAQGIDGDGRLVVALDGGGQTAIGSGEVHLERIGR
jgi:BirA family biotin operon repressor/biotin-[acetyl-CoA-carboxylase] ligase